MLLYAIQDKDTDEYFCAGEWGEEPEWFQPEEILTELQRAQGARPAAVCFHEDHSATEWT